MGRVGEGGANHPGPGSIGGPSSYGGTPFSMLYESKKRGLGKDFARERGTLSSLSTYKKKKKKKETKGQVTHTCFPNTLCG